MSKRNYDLWQFHQRIARIESKCNRILAALTTPNDRELSELIEKLHNTAQRMKAHSQDERETIEEE